MAKIKVLVCDDDREVLDMVETILSLHDFEVHIEADSRKVLGLVRKLQPDRILLDLWMPIISGQQVLESLKSNEATASIPVIAFSASQKGREMAEDCGADGYISKPFDMEELVGVLRK